MSGELLEAVARQLGLRSVGMASCGLKATVENTRGSVEKLSPKESVKGAHTVLRSSVGAPEGF